MGRFHDALRTRPRTARPQPGHRSALTIALSYIAGGFIPLVPYMLIAENAAALRVSVVVTLVALALFGALKGRLLGSGTLRSALQTVSIGGAAAAVAYLIAHLLNSRHW